MIFFIFGRHKLVPVKMCQSGHRVIYILCTFPTQKIQMFLKIDSHIISQYSLPDLQVSE